MRNILRSRATAMLSASALVIALLAVMLTISLPVFAQGDASDSAAPETPNHNDVHARWVSPGVVSIDWADVAGATYYDVRYYADDWVVLDPDGAVSGVRVSFSGASATVRDLPTDAQWYFFQVRAGNANGASGWSFMEQVTVPDDSGEPEPTPEPTATPTPQPTATATPQPTAEPTPQPTATPTPQPTATPTPQPTATPTPQPTATPTPQPTATPTPEPTAMPTPEPTPEDADSARDGATDLGDITDVEKPLLPTGDINGVDDAVDYFRFTLGETKKVHVGLWQQETNADLFLEDADGAVIASRTTAGTGNEDIKQALLAGTYYVRIAAQEAGDSSYVFRYGVNEPPPPDRVVLVEGPVGAVLVRDAPLEFAQQQGSVRATMELSWSPVAGAHGYVVTRLRFNDCGSWDYSSAVEIARVGSGVFSASDQVQAGNRSDLNRLVEGAWYQYSVAALRNGVEGERRNALLRVPATGEPGPIWGLSTAEASPGVRLRWGAASGAAFYRVCRGPDVVSSDDGPTSTSFTDSAAPGGMVQWYRVAAVSASGVVGPVSPQVAGRAPCRTNSCTIGVVNHLEATVASDGAVTLTWDPPDWFTPSDNGAGSWYAVFRRQMDLERGVRNLTYNPVTAEASSLVRVSGTDTTVTWDSLGTSIIGTNWLNATGVADGKPYKYAVIAISENYGTNGQVSFGGFGFLSVQHPASDDFDAEPGGPADRPAGRERDEPQRRQPAGAGAIDLERARSGGRLRA